MRRGGGGGGGWRGRIEDAIVDRPFAEELKREDLNKFIFILVLPFVCKTSYRYNHCIS